MKLLRLVRTVCLVSVACFAASAALAADDAAAADAAAVQRGKVKFQRTCSPCHGSGPGDDGRPMLPGTTALQLKYKGTVPAVLEARGDLNAAVLKGFVRSGSWSMPPFRKTELSDAEIGEIAAYLATSAKSGATTSR
ncbi:MAG: cytochrome c [Pseudomonadota bacterium]